MTKCDFCTKSNSEGKCYWYSQKLRENDCGKAIKAMMEVLKTTGAGNLKDKFA